VKREDFPVTTINRKATLAALDIIKPALITRKDQPQLSHVWFDGEYAYAHNGGLGIKTKLEMPIECGVPGALFMGLLNQTSTEEIEFTLTEENLSFKSGRTKVKLATMPADKTLWRYPDKGSGKPLATIKASKGFLSAAKHTLMFNPVNTKRMEFHAICIYAVEKEMDLITTDQVSMVLAPVAEPIVGTAKKIALPRELAEQLVSKCAPGASLQMYSDHFRIDTSKTTTMFCNVLDTTDMMDLTKTADRLLDKAVPFKVPEGFTGALERAVLLSGSEEATVNLTASGKALKLSGKYPQGQLDEDFVLAKSHAKATIAADAKIMLGIKGVTEIAIMEQVINFYGAEDFTYMLAGKKKVAVERDADPEEDQEEAA
jgi:DNA polymerase III sliding clamp (beta) subunit (PCNA family)